MGELPDDSATLGTYRRLQERGETDVAMVVFVVPGAPEVSLGPEVAAGLAALGINRVTLLRDPDGVAVVVEGWAFDESSAPDAIAALGVGGAARTMMMVAETSISRDPLRAASLSADTGG